MVQMVSESQKQMVAEILRDAADTIEAFGSLPFEHETDMVIKQIFRAQRLLAMMGEQSDY